MPDSPAVPEELAGMGDAVFTFEAQLRAGTSILFGLTPEGLGFCGFAGSFPSVK